MNVQDILKIVLIMLFVPIRMDRSLVHVKLDIVEMVNRVKVRQCFIC